MNLKRRLTIANGAAVVIPVIITVVCAAVSLFVYTRWQGAYDSFDRYSRLSQIKLELSGKNSPLQYAPERVGEKDFQNYLLDRLQEIEGEVVILKGEEELFSSHPFNKIDLAKFKEAGRSQEGRDSVLIGNLSYSVQSILFKFKDGTGGEVLLLAPIGHSRLDPLDILFILGGVFIVVAGISNLLVSYSFSRRLLTPLHNLQKAAAEITRGNLDYQIIEEGDKEISELCRDLEMMRIKLKDLIHTQLKYEENRKMLISSISHDLKTPVTSIKGYVEGIRDGVANTPEKREKYLETIYSKANQVDTMIDDLLLYAKLDLNQIPFQFELIDITDYLKQCVVENETELERQGIRLELVDELQQNQVVLLDRERMRRVIMNILDNSRKYMNKPQGEIKIKLRGTPASIIIEIRDNGAGVEEQDLPHIFDRFYRSDRARSGIKGSGLGLAIAKQIIEGHHGKVWAIGHGEQGLSITISLRKGLQRSRTTGESYEKDINH